MLKSFFKTHHDTPKTFADLNKKFADLYEKKLLTLQEIKTILVQYTIPLRYSSHVFFPIKNLSFPLKGDKKCVLQ
ncbi:MAG: hypothetical protein ACD_29C00098G0002 [uncultured bacterium]|nr:MAG: hypothetical protein ACD_29C00098G0002 [uncultured bacterium]